MRLYRIWLFILITSLGACTSEAVNRDPMVNLKKVSSKASINLADINLAINRNPNNAALYAKRAAIYAEKNNQVKALADINHALELDPNNSEFHFRQALILRNAGKTKLAYEAATEAEKLGFKGIEVNILQAELLIRLKNYSNSLEKVNIALESAPYNEYALFYKALAQVATGDTAFAVINFRRAIRNDPAFINPHLQLANIYNAKRDYELANRYIKSAARLNSQNGFLWYQKGIRYQGIRQPDSVYISLNKAIALDNSLYLAHYRLALLDYKNLNYNGAVAHLEQVIPFTDNLGKVREILAESYEKSGRYRLALKEYNKVLKIQPNDVRASWGVRRSMYALYKVKRDSLRRSGISIYSLEKDTTNFNF